MMAAFTNKEVEALKKFRPLVADLNLDEETGNDHQLVRWLRARDLHVQQANEMLRKSLKWRETNKIAEIATWEPPANFHHDYPYDLEGQDKDGCPLLIIPWGKWNVRKAVEAGLRDDYQRYIDQAIDKAFAVMRKQNKGRPADQPITQVSVICDMEGFSMKQITHKATVDCMLESTRRTEANYPELMKSSYMINAPKFFALLFALIKPLLTQRTLEKVQIFGPKKKKWAPGLQKLVNADQLPTIYGGSRTLNTHYLEAKGSVDDGAEEGMCVVSVNSGDVTNVVLDVKHVNSTLSWSFRTDEGDIGFAVYFNEGEQLMSQEKVDAHAKQQEGTYTCNKPGRYTLVFDNSHGKAAKTLHYSVSVSSAEESDDEAE